MTRTYDSQNTFDRALNFAMKNITLRSSSAPYMRQFSIGKAEGQCWQEM